MGRSTLSQLHAQIAYLYGSFIDIKVIFPLLKKIGTNTKYFHKQDYSKIIPM